jgi:tRNA uridine 5-carbamoylmethylation protein Kti12
MVIFMTGYPFSGKTFVVDKLVSELGEDNNKVIINLSPKSFYDSIVEADGVKEEELSETVRSEWMLSAWECSLERLKEFIEDCNPSDIIIYDSCCASVDNMLPYFKDAKECGHRIIFVLVICKLSLCKERAANKLPDHVWKSYTQKFKVSISTLSKISDNVLVIENNIYNKTPDLSKIMEVIDAGRIH